MSKKIYKKKGGEDTPFPLPKLMNDTHISSLIPEINLEKYVQTSEEMMSEGNEGQSGGSFNLKKYNNARLGLEHYQFIVCDISSNNYTLMDRNSNIIYVKSNHIISNNKLPNNRTSIEIGDVLYESATYKNGIYDYTKVGYLNFREKKIITFDYQGGRLIKKSGNASNDKKPLTKKTIKKEPKKKTSIKKPLKKAESKKKSDIKKPVSKKPVKKEEPKKKPSVKKPLKKAASKKKSDVKKPVKK